MSAPTRARELSVWVLLLAGPVLWFAHFMAVYLLVEGACALDTMGGDLLGFPALATLTLAATGAAVAITAATTTMAYRRWRRDPSPGHDWLSVTDGNAGLAFAGFVLGLVFAAAILFVGVPAAFLDPC